MTTFTSYVIILCWGTFFIVWLAMAAATKPTVQRQGRSRYFLMPAVLAIAVISLRRSEALPLLNSVVLPRFAVTGIVAVVIVIAGLAAAIAARVVLAGNWSIVAAIKQDHELIERGPYRFVRHPIYSGVLLMLLGTAIQSRLLASFLIFGVVMIALWRKAREEEKLLARHFPDAYPAYAARTKALIPFVL